MVGDGDAVGLGAGDDAVRDVVVPGGVDSGLDAEGN